MAFLLEIAGLHLRCSIICSAIETFMIVTLNFDTPMPILYGAGAEQASRVRNGRPRASAGN
jgi:hypothetical protein